MEDILFMSRKQRDRSKVLDRIKAKTSAIKQAAEILHISYRRCRRMNMWLPRTVLSDWLNLLWLRSWLPALSAFLIVWLWS